MMELLLHPIATIREWRFCIKNCRKFERKFYAIRTSDKVVLVQPSVRIDGLEDLKKSLYIDGNNLLMDNITMNIEGRVRYLLTLFGDNVLITQSTFTSTPLKKTKK